MPGREHRFVGELARRLPASSQALIGDDAAVVDGMVVSVDSLVEGVDFLVGWGTPADIGWKSLAVAVSDLAAMAARPLTAVVAVVIGKEGEAFWTGVYEGLAEAGAPAMLDVSAGLSTDALRLANASGVDVELNAAWIPMAGGLEDVSLALSGGEDFVICFSLPPERAAPPWAAPVGRLVPLGEG